MSSITIAALLDKAPDAQFVGGVVLLHVESKNVEIGKLVSGEEVVLTEEGDSLLESVAAPAKKSRKRVVEETPADPPVEPPAQ